MMTAGMANEQITEIRSLIIAKRYSTARAMLKTLNHPRAQEWLANLDVLERQQPTPQISSQSKDKTLPSRKTALSPAAQADTIVTGNMRSTPQVLTQSKDKTLPSRKSAKSPSSSLNMIEKTDPAATLPSRGKTLYQDETFTITGKEVVIQDAVYPLRQINGVTVSETTPAPDDMGRVLAKGIVALLSCVVLMVFFYSISQVVALAAGTGVPVALCWLIWKLMGAGSTRNYALRFSFAVAEEDAFVSHNKTYLTQIVSHINSALGQAH